MSKKMKSTVDKFIASLNTREKKKLNEEYQELLLSEIVCALMEKDNISVRKLAEMAKLSPTVIQAMRSGDKKDFSMKSFFKVLKELGCKSFMIEINGQLISLSI